MMMMMMKGQRKARVGRQALYKGNVAQSMLGEREGLVMEVEKAEEDKGTWHNVKHRKRKRRSHRLVCVCVCDKTWKEIKKYLSLSDDHLYRVISGRWNLFKMNVLDM